jgi:spore maturation protein CgeB
MDSFRENAAVHYYCGKYALTKVTYYVSTTLPISISSSSISETWNTRYLNGFCPPNLAYKQNDTALTTHAVNNKMKMVATNLHGL